MTDAPQLAADAPPPLAAALTPRLAAGLFLLAFGLLETLEALAILDDDLYQPYLPLGFAAIGLAALAQRRYPVAGSLLLFGGLWSTLARLGAVPLDLGDLWPLGLVVLGLLLVRHAVSREAGTAAGGAASLLAVLSTVERRVQGELRRGSAVAIAGGGRLDLREAQPRPGATVRVFALWGGIEVVLPEGVAAVDGVFPVMGAYEDLTTAEGVTVDAVRLRGAVLMGGVEVRNEPGKERDRGRD